MFIFCVQKISLKTATKTKKDVRNRVLAKGNWPMNNSMNFLKRVTAMLLALLIVTTMMGDDFFSLAGADGEIISEVGESAPSESAPAESTPVVTDTPAADGNEAPAGDVVPATEEPILENEDGQPIGGPEDSDGDVGAIDNKEPNGDENPENPQTTTDPAVDDFDAENTNEDIDSPENDPVEDIEDEDKLDADKDNEDEDCQHEYVYIANGDGTHTKKCEICLEETIEDCSFDEEGICTVCGYHKEAEECNHEELEYISNDDGTHVVRCINCGEVLDEHEACHFNEDWICEDCGYEDMSLTYQEFSKTIHGTTVTVSGQMPRNSSVSIYTRSLTMMDKIINEALEEGSVKSLEAFDITIYDRHNEKYQPQDDNNSVNVTFSGVEELNEYDDSDIVIYRIEDDQTTVTEMASSNVSVAGDNLSFEAEHFSTYVATTISSNKYTELKGYQKFAYIGQGTANYTRINGTTFYTYYAAGGSTTFKASLYKNLESSSDPTTGTLVDTNTYSFTTTGTGYYRIDIDFPNVVSNPDSYITKGKYYSVVIEMSTTTQIGYGRGSTATYISGTSGTFSRSATYDGIFDEDQINTDTTLANKVEYTTVSDSYEIVSIAPKSGTADTAGNYHYEEGDTTTFVATLSADVERTVAWSSSDTDVATIDASTGAFTAIGPGTTTITATYNGKSVTVNVSVLTFYIGGTKTLNSIASYSTEYTGSAITPAVVAYNNASSGTATLTSAICSNNTEVGTAQIDIKYTVEGTVYSYTKYFNITAIDITKVDSSNSKTAFDDASFSISNGSISAVTNVNTNSALSVTPSFDNGDFSVEIANSEVTSAGISATLSITGANNFTGSISVATTIKGTNITDLYTVALSSSSRLKDVTYTGSAITLTETSGGWGEVSFYDMDGSVSTGIITKDTATYKIYNYGTTTEDATTAGRKTITFEMNADSGYTGTLSVNFTIQKASLANTTISWLTGQGTEKNQFYRTGSAIEPVAGTDFKVFLGSVEIDLSEYEVSYPTANHTDVTSAPCTLYLTSNGVNFTAATSNSSNYYVIANYATDIQVIITDDDGNTYTGTKDNDFATSYAKYYDGTADIGTISVYLPGKGNLTKGTDVAVNVYADASCTDTSTDKLKTLGTKYIKIEPIGTYASDANAATIVATYTVEARPLSSGVKVTKSTSASSKIFTGADITLTTASTTSETSSTDLIVKYGSNVLVEGTDYEIVYSNNYNVGTATYTFKGLGNYTGTLSGSNYRFTIKAAELTNSSSETTKAFASIISSTLDTVYNGNEKKPSVQVKIGGENGTTIEQVDSKNDGKANYSLNYVDNVSPGTATITVTGANNLTGSCTLNFTITSSTNEYKLITIEGTPAVLVEGTYTADADGVITRIYTCPVTAQYDGTAYNGTVNVFGVDTVNPLTGGTDYYAEFKNANKAATYTVGDTTNSPYLEITGMRSYENNNAIVYFNITQANIENAKITGLEDSYAWTEGAVVQPKPVITFGSTTLVENTDYTIEYFESNENGKVTDTAATQNAGYKVMVITGMGNFTGSVNKVYIVGTDISTALVRIQSGYYSTVNDEVFYPTDTTTAQYGKNNSTKGNPIEVYWRNSKAPTVMLADASTSTALTEGSHYTVGEITSSISSLSGDTLYDAREAKGKGTDYNVITYPITATVDKGYYGTATVYYRINPQTISITSSSRMQIYKEMTKSQAYAGETVEIEPGLIFTYAYSTNGQPYDHVADGYSIKLSGDTDFTPATINVGSIVGEVTSQAVQGIGNYTGQQTFGFEITKGYVNLYLGAAEAKDGVVDTTGLTKLGTTTSAATSYDLTDSNQTYYTTYTYTGKEICPDITVTATNGKTALVAGTDYTITLPDDMITPGDKTITITIADSHAYYEPQTITINYKILSNSIANYTGTLTDITYAAADLNAADIVKYISNKTASIEVKSASETLVYNTDYTIITDDNVTDADEKAISALGLGDEIYGGLDAPSEGGAYIYVKGNLPYSGYLKISFNLLLNLGSAYADVSIASPYYELDANGKTTTAITPVINYRTTTDAEGTYSGVISKPLDNSEVTRAKDTLPGEDANITVTGKGACTGEKTQARYVSDTGTKAVVYFKADLSNYSGITMNSGTLYEYTGSAVTVSFSGLEGATAWTSDAIASDYKVVYTTDYENYATSIDAIAVGTYYAVIVPTSESKYFIFGKTTGSKFSFQIKYNLATATIKYYSGTATIDKLPYTGSEIKVPAVIYAAYDAGESIRKIIYNYNDDSIDWVTVTPTSVTQMGEYAIVATPKDESLVYGRLESSFTVSGVDIKECTIALSGTTFAYTGSAIEPTVTVTHSGTTLKLGTDYTVSYSSNIQAGTAKAVITGINAYSGAVEETFTITSVALTADMITVDAAYYAGKDVKVNPAITVKLGNYTLSEGKDYTTPVYTNNTYARTDASVTISAGTSGNFTGTVSKNYTISKLDLRTADITVSPESVEWTGSVIDPYTKVTVKLGDVTLTPDKTSLDGTVADSYDYKIIVLNGGVETDLKNQGTYQLRIDAGDSTNCEQYKEIEFTVTKRSLPNNYHYYYSTEKKDFVGSWKYYTDIVETDEATTPGYITTGGSSGDSLTIHVYDVVSVDTGSDNYPQINIVDSEVQDSDGNYDLVEGKDFELTVSNAKAAGSAAWNRTVTEDKHATVASTSPAVTITGIGNYEGEIVLPFNIGKNINTMNLTITYTANGNTYDYDSEYDNPTKAKTSWQYTYNGMVQKPTVTVYNGSTKLAKNKAYTVTYTNADGETDSSVNAGYKNIVITGIGDYCGTISQMYSINRKAITAKGGPYTTENPMTTTGQELTFTITGGVTRFTEKTVATYLVETGKLSETDAAKFVGYYYGIYDGEAIEPTVTVTDNTLGTNGKTSGTISKDDLDIGYDNQKVVSTFTNVDGSLSTFTYSDISIGFKTTGDSAETDFSSSGNYYVASSSVTYHIRYLIVQHNIEDDFEVQFLNGINGNEYSYDEGNAVIPKIKVTNGSTVLVEDDDYEVSYLDDDGNITNITPGVATLNVTGIGNYRGTKTLNFYIWGNLSDTETYFYDDSNNFVEGIPTQQYTGTSITTGDPQIYLVLPKQNDQTEDLILTYGTHYNVTKVTPTDNYVTYGTVEYTGLAESYWSGTKSFSYDIEFDASDIKATNYKTSYTFTGHEIKPDFELNVSTAEIDTDNIKYYRDGDTTSDLTSLGTISVVIPYSIGSYSGTVPAEYTIDECPLSDESILVVMASNQRYTGRAVTPNYKIYISSTDLQTGSDNELYPLEEYDEDTKTGDFTVDYGTNYYGTGSITFTGKSDEISGTRTETYNIHLNNIVGLDITENTGTSLTATWINDLYADGTQIILSQWDASSGKYKDVEGTSVTSPTSTYTFTGLTSSTSYKIKVRPYAKCTADKSNTIVYSAEYSEKEATTDIASSDISVSSNSSGKATVTWKSTDDVTLYYIYRTTDASSTGKIVAIIPASTGSYTNSGLTTGGTYYYYAVGYSLSNGALNKVNSSDYVEVTVK